MKAERQKKILEIISQEKIETQDALIAALAREGVHSTQATLSRDIRDLRLVKEGGAYRRAAGETGGLFDRDARLKKIFRESVVDYAAAQNLIVIKTLPGLADAACSTLDGMDIPGLVGSIAGDDTAFVAMRDNAAALRLCEELKELL